MFRPRHSQVRRKASCFAAAFLLAFVCCLENQSALAGSATWNGTTNSTWSTSSNWTAGGPPGTGNTATFSNAGNGNTTLDLGAGVTVNTVLFDTSSVAAYTIGSGAVGSQTLTLNNGGAVTMNATVATNQLFNAAITLGTSRVISTYTFTNDSTTNTLTFAGNITDTSNTSGSAGPKTLALAGAGNGTISGIISDGNQTTVGITKSGTGTWTLSGANTYAGGTSVIAGTIGIGSNTALGTGTLTLGGTSANTPTILASGAARTIANNVSLGAVTTGNATIGGSNDLIINGSVTNSGSNRTLAVNNAGTTTLDGNVFLSENSGTGRTLTITGTGNLVLGGNHR